MKKIYFTALVSLLFNFVFNYNAQAQKAFRKGSLLVSVSEGVTWAKYTTSDITPDNSPIRHEHCIDGTRDPLIVEYGLSDKLSIGLTSGADIFNVKSSEFYGFGDPDDNIKITTGEFTVDCGYHFLVTKRLDLSASGSMGLFSTNFNETKSDVSYKYTANGTILRLGTRARYYLYKRFGVFGMASTYLSGSSPKDVKGNTVATTRYTKINGFAFEAGLCFRFF